MTDYQKYINALRKCAKEHENDRTSTGHIIVSDLCRDTANLLESLEQEPRKDEVILTKEEYGELVSSEFDNGYAKGYREALEQEPTTKNDLGVDCLSRAEVNQVIEDYMDEQYNVLSDRTRERAFGAKVVMARINELPSVTPQEPRKGHWIGSRRVGCGFGEFKEYIVPLKDGFVTDSCHCSECGEWLTGSDEYQCSGNFCPNCGADMREVEE